MTNVLEADRRPFPTEPPARRPASRRMLWILWIAAGALFAAALGYLIPDQVQAHDRYGQAHSALGVTRQQTHTVTRQLDELRRDVNILQTQVGSDSPALSQDSSQLLGAQTALSAAQAHVTQQKSLITSLQTCLVGVERALNELSIGKLSNAIAALNSVSPSCTAAEASSG
jgi:hypothetical protein